MSPQSNSEEGNLVTPYSLALSLAPPRAPPLGSAHRNLLCNKDPSRSSMSHHHASNAISSASNIDKDSGMKENEAGSKFSILNSHHLAVQHHHGIRGRVQDVLHSIHLDHVAGIRPKMPHPHLHFAPDSGDAFTRRLGSRLPIWLQHKARDGGSFRSLSDSVVTATVPSLAIVNREAAKFFFKLTREKQTISYGKHDMQFVDLFLPDSSDGANDPPRGLIFFVHGGAWGSGMPWMYRLTSKPFLDANIAVAVVGYRTYPDGNVQDQIDDIEAAAKMLYVKFPHLCKRPLDAAEKDWTGISLIGHSSGAHIAMMMLVGRIDKYMEDQVHGKQRAPEDTLCFDTFIGMSGVYSISHHFDYEAGRGVEELSPMKAACGYTRKSFDHYSPAMKLQSLLGKYYSSASSTKTNGIYADEIIHEMMPEMLLLHGAEDNVVPFTSTAEAGRLIRQCGVKCCKEHYLSGTGHPDVVMELMLGGKTQKLIMKWIQNRSKSEKINSKESIIVDNTRSKL